MRTIRHIVIHCTATPQSATVESIQRYWREVLKWRNPGYHFIIRPDGSFVRLAPDESVTNGVAGHNANSIHISYIGGVDATGRAVDNRTLQQQGAMLALIRFLRSLYPHAEVLGHRDFPGVRKDCPSFDVRRWLASMQ